jgi:DNA repair exonuclease SbcCD ATPase subunit
LSPKFDFFKRKTSDYFNGKKGKADSIQTVTYKELVEIVDEEKKHLEKDLITDLEPARKSIKNCLDNLRNGADELEGQEIKVENPQFESLINNSKKILISSIKKDSFIESSEINGYEDAVKFKNNLELLINRFGQVGDSHNRILNEFMHKQLNKLKNEFENLSSLLKEVTRIISVKESQINKVILCRDDLNLFKEKLNEKKDKQERLSELTEEIRKLDTDIEESKRQYEDFQRSEEFLSATDTLQKIKDKKGELLEFEKNLMSMVSNLSRPITKYSYLASKLKQQRLAVLQSNPLEIFNDEHQFIQLLGDLKKHVLEKKIQIKDPEKTIHQIDEIVNSINTLSANLKKMKEELTRLESSVNSTNMTHLEEIKGKIDMYEKYRADNISDIEQTKNNINEINSTIETLKKKIEGNMFELTKTNYSVLRDQSQFV